jgi:hypothetical protein
MVMITRPRRLACMRCGGRALMLTVCADVMTLLDKNWYQQRQLRALGNVNQVGRRGMAERVPMDQHAEGPLEGWPRSVIVGAGAYICAARGDVTTVRRPCATRMKI